MKITYKTAAPSLLFLAACLPMAAQAGINPDQTSAGITVPSRQAEVRTLQGQLEGYEQQLRVKSETVEQARQEAISAGIQGDGAGSYIDAYRRQQMELEALQAALAPKIDRARNQIADLTSPDSPAASAPSQSPTPARKSKSVSKQKKAQPDQKRVAGLS
jgi:hypothetical protein